MCLQWLRESRSISGEAPTKRAETRGKQQQGIRKQQHSQQHQKQQQQDLPSNNTSTPNCKEAPAATSVTSTTASTFIPQPTSFHSRTKHNATITKKTSTTGEISKCLGCSKFSPWWNIPDAQYTPENEVDGRSGKISLRQ